VPPAASHVFELPAPVIRRGAALPVRRERIDPFEGRRFTALSLVTDAVMLWIAGACAAAIGHRAFGDTGLLLTVGLAAASMLRLASQGMYGARPARMSALDTTRQIVFAVAGATVVALAGAALLNAAPADVHGVALTGGLGAILTAGLRLAVGQARRRARLAGVSGKRALIIGAGQVGLQLERRLRTMPELGLEPVGFLDADPSPAYEDAGAVAPILGAPSDLAANVRRTGAEHVIIAFSNAPDSTVQPLIRQCDELGLEVSLVPRLFESINVRVGLEHIGGMPLFRLRTVQPKGWQFAIKHALDRLMAAALIVLLAPILIGAIVAVKLSSRGPIFFRQRRVGRDGRDFDLLKFRSMRLPDEPPADNVSVFLPGDTAPGGVEGTDRRTGIGKLMRRTSIDELPQLFNVLRGQMSIVGPRPERPEFVELFERRVDRYGDRLRVKSGITGWAQVHGLRGKTSLSDRIELDNFYIENWSLWLDVKILVMTVGAVFQPAE
jgi:exopolysaccharide biosynthesis polyprenyl glycosylphosphotransferase